MAICPANIYLGTAVGDPSFNVKDGKRAVLVLHRQLLDKCSLTSLFFFFKRNFLPVTEQPEIPLNLLILESVFPRETGFNPELYQNKDH